MSPALTRWPGRPVAVVPGLPQVDRCLVMGVVNTTPDSFSDAGRHLDPDAAVSHGLRLVEEGADLVDVGGESTRPGAHRVSPEEELRRVIPVVQRLAESGVVVSIDTMRAEVAARAVAAGAVLVNDVSGGLADEEMFATVASLDVPYVLMHWRGPSAQMDRLAHYDDVVAEVCAELADRVEQARAQGLAPHRLVVDPGVGFSKTPQHNWDLLAGLHHVIAMDYPVLVGTSRKRFLGALLAQPEAGASRGATAAPRPPEQRDAATTATTVLAAAAGVWGVRVHDAAGSGDAVRVVRRWCTGPPGSPAGEMRSQ